MVQVLPQIPSFGARLGQVLGGVGESVAGGLQKRFDRSALQNIINQLPPEIRGLAAGLSQVSPQYAGAIAPLVTQAGQQAQQDAQLLQAQQKLRAAQPQVPQRAAGALSPEQQQVQQPTQSQAATANDASQPAVDAQNIQTWPQSSIDELVARGNIAAQKEQARRLLEQQRTEKRQSAYFKKNEDKLSELSDKLSTLETEDMQFDRLGELADSGKLPNNFAVALFSKGGQLNDKAYALLSPEGQEFIKIIVDNTKGIKDTYGARVTNFDLETYLKRLPSLLNSPKGRERVIRDLKVINQINRLESQGILQEFERAGGSDKIAWSQAQARSRKELHDQIQELRNEYVRGGQKEWAALPNAALYKGKRIGDPETGEQLISNGVEWIPAQGSQ